MSLIYIDDPKSVIGINGNRIVIRYSSEYSRSIPIELVEGITMLGPAQLTSQCMETCMTKGIPVSFLSRSGKYYGRLMSTGHMRPELQRKQCNLYDKPFSVEFAKKICTAKIKNQLTVIRRYEKGSEKGLDAQIFAMKNSISKIDRCTSIPEVNGYEGQAAKNYFQALAMCIDTEFRFSGRNRRPPKDPFNSMISLGYSIILNELYSEIEMRGMNPYFGFMHRDKENHPTLASDLIEEWRAALIDTTVMSLINGHEIHMDQFEYDEDGGCYLKKDGLRIFLNKLENKLSTKVKYFSYTQDSMDFRYGISLQVGCLIKAIEKEDTSFYHPLLIR